MSNAGMVDTRVIIQTSLPITSVTLTMEPTATQTTVQQPTQPIAQHPALQTAAKQIANKSIQHLSLTDSRDSTPLGSPGHKPKKPFRFSSLRRKRKSHSTEASSPPLAALDTPDNNEAYILAFQRELQNLPQAETSPVPHLPTGGISSYSNPIASYLKEALERSVSPAFTRQRSCSVPRVTFDSLAPNSLQLPSTQQKPVSVHNSPMTRSPTAEDNAINIPANAQNLGKYPKT